LREIPTSVQPAGQPINHSTKSGDSRGPFLPGSVGAGAGRPSTRSHRRMAAA
jgi:hypothetical protein